MAVEGESVFDDGGRRVSSSQALEISRVRERASAVSPNVGIDAEK